MQCLVKTDAFYYCVGGRTGLGIRRAATEHQDTPFDPCRSDPGSTTCASGPGVGRTWTVFENSSRESVPESSTRPARVEEVTASPRSPLPP
jgi:hypothetical protein